jgi:P27 family predicted phage terminase small subunit
MRGRKPKPTARQIVEGDPRKKGVNKLQAKLESEPKVQRGMGECPTYLTGLAREAWGEWKEQLEIMEIDSMADRRSLSLMCAQLATSVRATEHIETEGEVLIEPVLSKDGTLLGHKQIKNDWVGIRAEADKILKQYCSDFGLSPVARTRIKVEKADNPVGDLAKLLSAPRVPRTVQAVN